MMQHTFYHSFLRIATLTLALVLVFESGLLNSATKELSSDAHMFLANAIGIQAGVTPNDLNRLTAELTAQRNKLAEREASLAEREIAVELDKGVGTESPLSIFILSSILFILLVLILLNYVLDYIRLSAPKPPLVTS